MKTGRKGGRRFRYICTLVTAGLLPRFECKWTKVNPSDACGKLEKGVERGGVRGPARDGELLAPISEEVRVL